MFLKNKENKNEEQECETYLKIIQLHVNIDNFSSFC